MDETPATTLPDVLPPGFFNDSVTEALSKMSAEDKAYSENRDKLNIGAGVQKMVYAAMEAVDLLSIAQNRERFNNIRLFVNYEFCGLSQILNHIQNKRMTVTPQMHENLKSLQRIFAQLFDVMTQFPKEAFAPPQNVSNFVKLDFSNVIKQADVKPKEMIL